MGSVFNKFDEYILITNENGDIIFANDKILIKLKYEKEELYKLNIKNILVDDNNFKIDLMEDLNDTKFDLNFYSKEKEIISVYSEISIDYFETKKAIFIISKDIKYKYYSIKDLEILLDNIDGIAFIKSIDDKILYANNKFVNTSSNKVEDFIGKYVYDNMTGDIVLQCIKNDKEILDSKKAISYNEKSIINGEEFWYDTYKSPIYDENGDAKYMVCTSRNITLEKLVREEIYKNYNQITNIKNLEVRRDDNTNIYDLLENIGKKIMNGMGAIGLSVLIYDKEKQGLVPYIKLKNAKKVFEGIDIIPINDKEYQDMKMCKYDGLKIVNKNLMRYDADKNYLQELQYALVYGINLYDESIGILFMLYNQDNSPTHNKDDFMKDMCNSIAMIIKNSRLLEEAKTESKKRISTEQELELYLSTAVDLVTVFDLEGYIRKINSNWTKILGWDEEEVINHRYDEFLCKDEEEVINHIYGEILSKDEIEEDFKLDDIKDRVCSLTNTYRHKDGSYVLLDWNFKYDTEYGAIIGTAKDRTEQKNIEIQKQKLEEKVHLERIKNEFFANISHEFKTPLNIILGITQLTRKNLDNGNLNVENLSRYTDTTKQNSYRLLRLVNNLIDISRIDIGYYNLQPSYHNIVGIIEDITLSVADYIEDKNINLIFDTDVEEAITSCDPDKIERVMLNLLSNAIKYTPGGGTIKVKISSDSNNVHVSVKDSGVGIAEDKLDIIFDRFGQANSLLSRRCEGSGIGLSLVKAIVEMHGGEIEVYSELGNGAEFVFNIPIAVLEEDDKHECIYNFDNKDFYIEKCNIEFSDIYS